jgi:hypothetical protein
VRVVDALKGRTAKGAGAASAVLPPAGAGQPRSRRPISGEGPCLFRLRQRVDVSDDDTECNRARADKKVGRQWGSRTINRNWAPFELADESR